MKSKYGRFIPGIVGLSLVALSAVFPGCRREAKKPGPWNEKYNFIYAIPSITFHYDHGILAGSYPQNQETTEVSFPDVCTYLGHVCLCGAGGYRIARIAVDSLQKPGEAPEKGDFILISSRDHTVSDVVSYVLGCSRRNDPGQNQYFIDTTVKAPPREYHYFIGYPPLKKAVHITYRKNLLMGNDQMDRLWKIEQAYGKDSASVSQADLGLYRDAMYTMVKEVLSGQKEGLFEARMMDYNAFLAMLQRLKTP